MTSTLVRHRPEDWIRWSLSHTWAHSAAGMARRRSSLHHRHPHCAWPAPDAASSHATWSEVLHTPRPGTSSASQPPASAGVVAGGAAARYLHPAPSPGGNFEPSGARCNKGPCVDLCCVALPGTAFCADNLAGAGGLYLPSEPLLQPCPAAWTRTGPVQCNAVQQALGAKGAWGADAVLVRTSSAAPEVAAEEGGVASWSCTDVQPALRPHSPCTCCLDLAASPEWLPPPWAGHTVCAPQPMADAASWAC